MSEMTREEQKQLYKEALKEFWKEQWNEVYESSFKWAAHILATAAIVGIAILAARLAGWQLVPPNA